MTSAEGFEIYKFSWSSVVWQKVMHAITFFVYWSVLCWIFLEPLELSLFKVRPSFGTSHGWLQIWADIFFRWDVQTSSQVVLNDICGPFEFLWRVFMGRALKFRIFLLVKIGPWEKSKNRAPFLLRAPKSSWSTKNHKLSGTIWLVGERCYLIGWASNRMVHWGGVPDELVLPCQSRHFFSNSVVALLVRLPRRHRPESFLHCASSTWRCFQLWEKRSVSTWCFETLRCVVWENAKCLEYSWPASTWREWRSCSYDRLQLQRWYIDSFRSHVSLLDGSFKSKEKSERGNWDQVSSEAYDIYQFHWWGLHLILILILKQCLQ